MSADNRFLNIPEELRQLTQWVNRRIEQRAGEPTPSLGPLFEAGQE
jgi:primase-polymerase (primpol)-like protein